MDQAITQIHATRGLANRIARACGISKQAVGQWERVPASRVRTVAETIGMPPEQIRPDIFGAAEHLNSLEN